MKVFLFLLFTVLCSQKAMACSCLPRSPAISFFLAEYVFEGTVISKSYPPDSLSYTVTFDVSKHYKEGDSPRQMSFTLPSGVHLGYVTSCDWDVYEHEKWLVYAYRWEGKLVFSGMCFDSKPLDTREIYPTEQKVLDNGNDFDPSKYVFTDFDGIDTYSKPANNIKDLLKEHQPSEHKKNRFIIMVDVDKKGRLIAARSNHNVPETRDSVFGLYITGPLISKQKLNPHEKEILKQVQKFKKWKVAFIPNSTTAVKYRRYFHFWY